MKETKTYKKLKTHRKTNTPTHIIVHHSGGTDKYPLADTSHHTAEIIERWHLSKPNWIGIGYHYVIHKDGEVWRGRPEHVHGAHCKAVNKKSIGICLAGNFDATLPTQAQETALTELLTELTGKYSIRNKNILPHRKFANKTCYGKKLSDTWAQELLSAPKVLFQTKPDCSVDIEKLEKKIKSQKSVIDYLINLIRKLFKK